MQKTRKLTANETAYLANHAKHEKRKNLFLGILLLIAGCFFVFAGIAIAGHMDMLLVKLIAWFVTIIVVAFSWIVSIVLLFRKVAVSHNEAICDFGELKHIHDRWSANEWWFNSRSMKPPVGVEWRKYFYQTLGKSIHAEYIVERGGIVILVLDGWSVESEIVRKQSQLS